MFILDLSRDALSHKTHGGHNPGYNQQPGEQGDALEKSQNTQTIDSDAVLSPNIDDLRRKMLNHHRSDINLSDIINPAPALLAAKYANTTIEHHIERELRKIMSTRLGSTSTTDLPIADITNNTTLEDLEKVLKNPENLIKIDSINPNTWLFLKIINRLHNHFRFTYLVRPKLMNPLSDTIYIYTRGVFEGNDVENNSSPLVGAAELIDFLYSIYSFAVYMMKLSEKVYYDDQAVAFDPDFPHIKIKNMDEYINYLKIVEREIE
jgi:hypothetical protein